MATRYYQVKFRATDTGLTPTFDVFARASDGTTTGLTPPSFTHRGRGVYVFGYDITGASPAIDTNDHIVVVVDGGAGITDVDIRYVAGSISPNDYNIDAAISSISPTGVWAQALPGAFTAGQAGYILGTNLDATVGSRSTQATQDIIDTNVDTILTRTDVNTSTRADGANYTATRAGYLDLLNSFLDATISGRASAAALTSLTGAVVAADLLAIAGGSTTEVRTNSTKADAFYDSMLLTVVNAAGTVSRNISGYLNTNGAFTVSPPLPFTPAASDRVIVTALPQQDAAAVVADIWSEALPGAFTAGQAGYILGTNLDAQVSDVETKVDAAQADIDLIQTDLANVLTRLARLRDLAEGKLEIVAPNQLKLYNGAGALIQTFDLFEIDASTPTTDAPFVRVPTAPATW